MSSKARLTDEQREAVEAFRRRHRTGVLTLLFTDVVGSSVLKRDLGDSAGTALIEKQQEVVRELLSEFADAEEISTAGDSFFIVFIRPSDAVRYTLLLHSRLRVLSERSQRPIAVRAGVHMGEVFIEQDGDSSKVRDILGFQVDLAHSIMELATGGQTLMSRSVFDNARAILHGEAIANLHPLSWLNHGPYRHRDAEEPFDICEVGEEALAPLSPPPDSEKARRFVSADAEPVLGWRPALEQVVPGTEWVLERKLGAGGFGEVWLASHKTMRERRVFKFCFRADRVRSLKREASLFRLLKEKVGEHPNIVRIHDVYFSEPPYYIETEYVKGDNLAAWWEKQGGAGAIPLETQLAIVAQVADALQAAHDSGVIHRDVKPSNILISGEGVAPENIHVKLTDFGIGQVVSRDVLAGEAVTGLTETFAGTELASRSGTRIYMAPEVVAGQRSSAHSDVYSLGVVLYQLAVEDLSRPLTVDWRDNVADPVLADDLARCFAGAPSARFESAAEFAKHLRSIESRRAARRAREKKADTLVEPPEARFSRMAVVGAFLGVLSIVALAAFIHGSIFGAATVSTTRSTGQVETHTNWGLTISMMMVLAIAVTGVFGTTILGVVSISRILRSAGRLYGLGLALFDALLFPLFAFDILIFAFWILVSFLIRTQTDSLFSVFGCLMLTLPTSAVADYLIVCVSWRALVKPCEPEAAGMEPRARGVRKWAVLGALALALSLCGVIGALLIGASGTADETQIPMLRFWFVSQVVALMVASLARRHLLGKAGIILSLIMIVVVLFIFFSMP